MIQVSIPEAEASLSELIQLLETKTEDFIIIARNGKPAVKITLVDESPYPDVSARQRANSPSGGILMPAARK